MKSSRHDDDMEDAEDEWLDQRVPSKSRRKQRRNDIVDAEWQEM